MGHSYKDLVAWNKAMELVTDVYKVTGAFPKEETYGLTSQLRRSAVSVPSNIAEGQGRWSRREFRQFLSRARGSLYELETQILISLKLSYLSPEQADNTLKRSAEVGRVLNGLMSSVKLRA